MIDVAADSSGPSRSTQALVDSFSTDGEGPAIPVMC